MNEQAKRRDVFLSSLERCTQSDEFVNAFYNRFLATSDEIREKFRDTDFAQQNKMLVRSLKLVAAATSGDPSGLRELRDRAETHDREHLDIPPKMYQLWRSSVIETAREYDPEWDEATEDAWLKILSYAIDYMVHRY